MPLIDHLPHYKQLQVKSGRSDNRVALWETHPAHPGGEAYVAGSKPVTVAQTPTVNDLLAAGVLVRVETTPTKKTSAPAPATPTKTTKKR